MIKSAIARVHGRVQGVGFRYSALQRASSLGLRGWVRNESDGTVTTRFEGPESNCDAFIDWLQRGPSMSHVSSVDIRDLNPDDDLGDFRVTY